MMVKVIYNDKLYKVVIWEFLGISLWKEKEALKQMLITLK